MSELEELRRRLTDLADAAGPWDDPLPQVRARVEAANRTPAVHRRWLATTNWGAVLTAAAVVIVVGLGGYVLTRGAGSSQKSSSTAGVAAQADTSAPHDNAAASCLSTPSSAALRLGRLQLSAPRNAQIGRPVTVQARFTPAGATSGITLGRLRVVVLSRGAAIGRLFPDGLQSTPSNASAAAPTVSGEGILRLLPPGSGCSAPLDAPTAANPVPASPAPVGRPLPPGEYQLVAELSYRNPAPGLAGDAGVLVSDPVDITVR